jgi:hypothetical protein
VDKITLTLGHPDTGARGRNTGYRILNRALTRSERMFKETSRPDVKDRYEKQDIQTYLA